jgi:Ca2+-binding EF-hand superfamily protein
MIDLCEFHLFFGFPICEYNCPYLSCNNCGLEPCESCKTEGQCPIHTKSNFKNDENKILNERTYKTYYTEFLNKNNKKEEKEEEQLNNGYQKISNNLTLQLSPKREYAPFEVAFDSKNIFKMSNENYNLKSGETFNNENINTINQNFIEKNQINNDLDFKSNYIINKQNLFNNNIIENNENIDNNNEINFKSNIDDKSINRSLNKNEYEEKQFLDYLRKSMEHENKIENLKIELSLRSDFYWEQVFRIFEFEGSGYLSKEDLIKGFKNFNLYPKDIDITLFLKRYDLKKEGALSYPDFFELIAPFSKYHRLMVENRKINTDLNEANPNEFNSETQKCIKNLFNEIFIGEFSLNKDKETFSSLKKQFNNIFKTIDSSNNGFIGEKDFVLYIQNNGLFKSSNDCDLLFRRFNKLRNGKIDYQEIIDEIEPIY